MEIKNKKDRMMKPGEVQNKTEGPEIEFFFSGGTEYLPQAVRAKSIEEAESIWLQTRKKVDAKTTGK